MVVSYTIPFSMYQLQYPLSFNTTTTKKLIIFVFFRFCYILRNICACMFGCVLFVYKLAILFVFVQRILIKRCFRFRLQSMNEQETLDDYNIIDPVSSARYGTKDEVVLLYAAVAATMCAASKSHSHSLDWLSVSIWACACAALILLSMIDGSG